MAAGEGSTPDDYRVRRYVNRIDRERAEDSADNRPNGEARK